jgi:hypothetical protein
VTWFIRCFRLDAGRPPFDSPFQLLRW